MQLTVTTTDDRIVVVDVEPKELVENVKAILEVETGIPLGAQTLLFNSAPLANERSLDSYGIKENDLMLLTRTQPRAPAAAAGAGGRSAGAGTATAGVGAAAAAAAGSVDADMALNEDGSAANPAAFRRRVLANPEMRARLSMAMPALGEAIEAEDVEVMQNALRRFHDIKKEYERKMKEEEDLLYADPFDPAVQAKIEEKIKQDNIEHNYQTAMEEAPESFISVHMLYVDMEVNNHKIKAFIDSGAQQSIMSQQCAERCGLMRLVDTRYQGVAMGVGTSKIVGRIHAAPLKIGSNHYTCSISVLEAQNMEFLFGLDMLRRHQCCIDLQANVLRVGGGEITVPFLSEMDVPKKERMLGDTDMLDAADPSAAAGAGGSSTLGGAGAGAGRTPPQSQPTPSGSAGAAASAPAPAAPPALPLRSQPQPSPSLAGGTTVVHPPIVPAPSAAATAPAGSGRGVRGVSEASVVKLMELGFPRDQVVQALLLTGGNEEQAVGILFAG